VVRAFAAGDCFGEVSLIDLGPRSGTARAVAPARAIAIGSELLYALYERDVGQFSVLFMNLTREICRRLRDAEARLTLTWRTRDEQRGRQG
jgi:CRP-like cAMP-binding protein